MRGRWLQAAVVAAVALPIVLWAGVGYLYGSLHHPAPQPSATARGPRLYVANAFGDAVQVIDLASGTELGRLGTGRLPRALTPDGKLLYVTVAGAQAIAALDTSTDRLVAKHIVGSVPETASHLRLGMAKVRQNASCAACHPGVVVGSEPGPATLGPDGKLYLAETLGGQLSQLDRPGLETRRTIGVAHGAPTAVLFHPKSRDGYVVTQSLGGSKAVPSGLSAVPWLDGEAAGPSWLTVYDPAFQVVRWRLELPGAGAHDAAFSPDGGELYVTLRGADKLAVVDTARRAVARTFPTAAGPSGQVTLPDNGLAITCYTAHPGAVQVLDARTGTIRKQVEVPASPVELARDPASGKLYVAAAGANLVAEVDPAAGTLTRTFKAGAAPVAVAVVP
jgi:YVTN family beta-propeller protein